MLTKKRILPIFISFLMAFAMMPLTAGKAHATEYNIEVGGVPVTDANAGDILGNGTASYNPNTGTLTLNGATISNSIYASIPVKIELIGENKVSGSSVGIQFSGWGGTITGPGSLIVEGSNYGIYSSGDITIDSTTVSATGYTNSCIHSDGSGSDITITNSKVTVTSENNTAGIQSGGDITISGSTVTASPEGFEYGIQSGGELKIDGSSKVHAEGESSAIISNGQITIGDGLAITEPANGTVYYDFNQYYIHDNNSTAKSATIEPVYAINLAKTTNGTVTQSAQKAAVGKKVTVTATPDKGYILDKMTYTDKDGKVTDITSSGEITMPASAITVNVTFKKQNVKPGPTEPTTKPTTKPAPKPAPAAKVSGTLLAKMTAKGKKNLVLSWNKIDGAQGYDVFFVKCNHNNPCKLVETIKGNETFKWTKKKLKKKTAYKAYVRAWVMKDGKKSYVKTSPTVHAYTSGSTKHYTNAKKVTVKKSEVSLKKGDTYQIKAKVKKLKKGKKLMKKGHGPKLRYLSSNTKVAAVSSSGKIRARAKGKCSVYVYAVNGVHKTIKVTVK